MPQISLTKGKFTIVDDADLSWLSQWKWYAHRGGKSKFYAARREKGRTVLLHRELISVPAGLEIDHIDGDGLNNRRENLRVVTHSQNLMNQGPRSNKDSYSSRFVGVSYSKANKKWQAYIKAGDRQKHLGRFLTEELALKARQEAAKLYFGEFRKT